MHLVLDVGNVLVSWDPLRIYRPLLGDAGARWFLAHVCDDAFNHALDAGGVFDELAPPLMERFPEHTQLIRAWRERLLEAYEGPIEGMAELVARWRSTGRPLWGLTNFCAEEWPLVQGHYPVLQQFDGVVVSGEQRACKPEPAIYAALERMAGVAPERLFFVDDREENVLAARARGWRAEVFTGAAALERQLFERNRNV